MVRRLGDKQGGETEQVGELDSELCNSFKHEK